MLTAKVMQNVDRRFPISLAMKINQLQDPEVKDIIPRVEGSSVLEQAIKNIFSRKLIQVRTSWNIEYSSIYVVNLCNIY